MCSYQLWEGFLIGTAAEWWLASCRYRVTRINHQFELASDHLPLRGARTGNCSCCWTAYPNRLSEVSMSLWTRLSTGMFAHTCQMPDIRVQKTDHRRSATFGHHPRDVCDLLHETTMSCCVQLQKSEREKPHSGKTKSHPPTKTLCNQPAIAIVTHAQTLRAAANVFINIRARWDPGPEKHAKRRDIIHRMVRARKRNGANLACVCVQQSRFRCVVQ